MLSGVILALTSLLGALSFLYPFLLNAPPAGSTPTPHAADAPVIFAVLMPLTLMLILAELGTRRANAKMIAALGILTAINAVLRIPIGIGDTPFFFFLPILIGYAYGVHWGFLLGALSMFVSAVLTAGIGPWLPFQMFALGWLGMGAAVLRPVGSRVGPRGELLLLAGYSYAGGMLFGALMNVYSWPIFGSGVAGLDWEPGLSLEETLRRYRIFYIATSLTWDTLRASFTAGFILVLGRPLLRELRRYRDRFVWVAGD